MTDRVAAAVAQLETVSLDELNAKAAMQTRRDRKYVVPISMLSSMLGGCGLRVLEIDGRRSFRYESVYFDTPDLISYKDASQKRRRRFKVRSRTYLDSNQSWLEVKTRERRGLNTKSRHGYDVDERAAMTADGRAFVKRFDVVAPVGEELEPVLVSRYRRVTLLDDNSASRITIDRDVSWESRHGTQTRLDHLAIVETKTAGAPCEFDHLLWSWRIRPIKISKYGTGLAALTPGLPANKWNRVLRRHLDWEPVRDQAVDNRSMVAP